MRINPWSQCDYFLPIAFRITGGSLTFPLRLYLPLRLEGGIFILLKTATTINVKINSNIQNERLFLFANIQKLIHTTSIYSDLSKAKDEMAVFAELNRECRLAGVIGMSGAFLPCARNTNRSVFQTGTRSKNCWPVDAMPCSSPLRNGPTPSVSALT